VLYGRIRVHHQRLPVVEILPDLVRVLYSILSIGPTVKELRIGGLKINREVALWLRPQFRDPVRPFGKSLFNFLKDGLGQPRRRLLEVHVMALTQGLQMMHDTGGHFGHESDEVIRLGQC